MRKLLRNNKGQGLVEYGILVGGIALVALAATAILGHKTTDLIATCAAALPCAHEDEANPIVSGKLVASTTNADGGLILDAANTNSSIENNLGITGVGQLVLEAE